jgi:hypothetical protein
MSRFGKFAQYLNPVAKPSYVSLCRGRVIFLLLIAGLPLGTSLAVFPQLFALAKAHLDRVGAETAERGTAMMRATWSIACSLSQSNRAKGLRVKSREPAQFEIRHRNRKTGKGTPEAPFSGQRKKIRLPSLSGLTVTPKSSYT